MSYVFISYAREDIAEAIKVRNALKARGGFNVWWDENLVAADPWNEKIESALGKAIAVVVLWSKYSVSSDWVRHEASFAQLTKKSVHCRLDDSDIPAIFSKLQIANLVDWDGKFDSKKMDGVISFIKQSRRRRNYSILNSIAPILVGVVAILASFLVSKSKQSDLNSSTVAIVDCNKSLGSCEKRVLDLNRSFEEQRKAAASLKASLDEKVNKVNSISVLLKQINDKNKALTKDLESFWHYVEFRNGKLYQNNGNTRIFYPQGQIVHCSGSSCSLYPKNEEPAIASWPY